VVHTLGGHMKQDTSSQMVDKGLRLKRIPDEIKDLEYLKWKFSKISCLKAEVQEVKTRIENLYKEEKLLLVYIQEQAKLRGWDNTKEGEQDWRRIYL